MTSDATRPGAGVAHTPSDLLDAAADRVRARIGEVYPLLAPGGSLRAEGYLGTLRGKLHGVLRGDPPDEVRAWLSSSGLFMPLMDALIHELVEAPCGPEAAAASLEALRACVRVRGTSPVLPIPDAGSEDLKATMRGPDAFELLVEVAHDLRSPLTSILFLAEALRDGHSGPVTDLQKSQLGLIYSAAFGLAALASDVMDLAKREQDLIGAEARPFAPSEVFRTVERMVRPLVEEKGLQLRTVVPERWQATGHPHALSRVLLNLTTNALKFTDEGSVELGVRPLPHGRLEYYVQDTGRGITDEQRRTLFQPFRRRSQRPEDGRYFSGSGIGLSIARRLLKAMGTTLTLDSSDERGTRFSFILPASGQS